MEATALAQPTKIAPWGNSDAIRIPRLILRKADLATGDSVDIVTNERNNIEVMSKKETHRRAQMDSRVHRLARVRRTSNANHVRDAIPRSALTTLSRVGARCATGCPRR